MSRNDAASGRASGLGRSVVLGGIGAIFGASIGDDAWGLLSGLALGLVYSALIGSRRAAEQLEQSIGELRERLVELDRARVGETGDAAEGTAPAFVEATPTDTTPAPTATRDATGGTPDASGTTPEPSGTVGPGPDEGDPTRSAVEEAFRRRAESLLPDPGPPAGPGPIERGVAALRGFLFGGNTVVRVGLLVLLVGLTLLAKYAAENALFPVEARLASAALVGLGLVGVGYRQRVGRPGFGLSLQGGGLAALYLVSFFAFRSYALLPAGLAFALFVGLAMGSALLAVLQRSQPLLVIGSLGGFLAPVLASTGEGSHVALFGYYLLLIASIAFVAWRQSWRIPALVAFFCTYAVATTWGVLRYEESDFATTQPFVLAFLALFTGIAVLHAWHRPVRLRGVVDGTLVFGTPFVSILLQGALVHEFELGLALSAAGFGAFYLAWAVFVMRRGGEALRPLAECFVALAVGFATMAIPFAFDEALTTSIAWALEGAGLYWVGARQARLLPRVSGMALQGAAALAFVASAAIDRVDSSGFLPIANGRALSCLGLAFAGLFIARQAWVHRDRLHVFETGLAQGLGVWGLLWWTSGSLAEISQFVGADYRPAAVVAWIAASAVALELAAERSDWTPGRWLSLASLPAATLTFLGALGSVPHLLAFAGWLAWPLLFASLFFLWERLVAIQRPELLAFRAGSLWLLAVFVGCALGSFVEERLTSSEDWVFGSIGFGLAGVLLAASSLHRRDRRPFDREPDQALRAGLAPIAALAALAILGLQIVGSGDARPLPHVPILNPIDLSAWLLALAVWSFWRRLGQVVDLSLDAGQRRALILACVALAFAWLNGLLSRAVSQWADVPHRLDALWESVAMQVVLSIAWTGVGLVGMLVSSRRGWRQPWMGCATLLGVVVLKLFTVDLSQLSTVARIGTFLAVGAMLLVLGYLSPVPPSHPSEERADDLGGLPEPVGGSS